MPTYDYKCERGHVSEISHSVADMNVLRFCLKCATLMHRVPSIPRVNWNGLPPHEADARPSVVNQFINDTPERRARYLDTKEKKHAS